MRILFKKDKIDVEGVNVSISLLNRILKLAYVLLMVAVIFVGTLIFKEWKVMLFLKTILLVCSPLFIGFVIAWLFNPIVTNLNKLGVNRILGSILVYSILILILVVFFWALIPTIVDQFNDLIKVIPNIIDETKKIANSFFDNFDKIERLDLTEVKNNLFDTVESLAKNVTINLPNTFFSVVSTFFSGASTFLISLIIGFYMLLNFDETTKHFLSLVPGSRRDEFKNLINEISIQLYRYVKGVLIIATGIFIICSLGFFLAGLKAPLLFGLFCAITNIIPYIGPYIGGIPAVLVGFSESTMTGTLTLIIILVVQLIESNVLQPIIMSKTMKLHPVSIIIGLILFGYFFGILGMVLATPTIALLKILYKHFMSGYEEHRKAREKTLEQE